MHNTRAIDSSIQIPAAERKQRVYKNDIKEVTEIILWQLLLVAENEIHIFISIRHVLYSAYET
jgi:hypothetical protein